MITKSQIVNAGKILKKEDVESEKYPAALDKLQYWRSLHANPLKLAHEELKATVSKIDENPITVSRAKRSQSIVDKLKRETSMSLTNMQDIGGCRAILRTLKDVRKVSRTLKKKKNIRLGRDYLKTPKDDGYRGIHLIGEYASNDVHSLNIEFQVRTRLQHSWATAGEITELFTSKAIKHLSGDKQWKAFYHDIADMFSLIDENIINRNFHFEKFPIEELNRNFRSLVSPETKKVINDLRRDQIGLGVYRKFEAYANSLQFAEQQLDQMKIHNGYVQLQVTDIKSKNPRMNFNYFDKNDIKKAQDETYELEKIIDGVVVLLSTESIKVLKTAYPNYFADSKVFLRLLNALLT